MAYLNSQGFVDDGTSDLAVGGRLTVSGPISSSQGAFAQLTTNGNFGAGQTLGAPNTWNLITQWLTSSITSPNVTAAANGITGSSTGVFFHSVTLSFSGSAGTYTFSMFNNGVQGNSIQTTIAAGQSFPVAITITDLDFHASSDLPIVHDVRVKSSNAGANFQMNYGTFSSFRFIG